MTLKAQHHETARNLIETLGVSRAMHAAEQFAWYDVMKAIANQEPAQGQAAAAADAAGKRAIGGERGEATQDPNQGG